MDDVVESKQYLLRTFSFIASGTIICYGAIYLFLFSAKKIAITCGISGIVCLFAPLIYSYFRSISLSIQYLVFSSLTTVIFTAIYTGGPKSPVLFWVTTVPLMGGFLTREAGGAIRWLGVSLLCFFAVMFHERIYGNMSPEVTGDYLAFVQYLALLGISIVNVIMIHLFQTELSIEHSKIEESRKELVKTQEELFQITSQVAHDIRSPLMAMKVISEQLDELSEEKRTLIRTAVRRVNDIASSLAYRNFERKYTDQREQKELTQRPVILAECIDQIVAEKRVQLRSNPGVEIFAVLDYNSYSIFTACSEGELRRILSNIVNNSIEAILEKGSVSLSLKLAGGLAGITIEDNGRGIPPGVLEGLGKRGVTFGKPEGSGLGLSYAKMRLESWGGGLKVESELGKGTAITLAVPATTQPSWFVNAISLDRVKEVVILDDEDSIHQVWNHRFSEYLKGHTQTRLRHFSSPHEFRLWIQNNPPAQERLFLLDYEFVGTGCTGIELILENSLGAHSILVTGKYDEQRIQDQCEKMSIRLLPKSLVRSVPITERPI